MGTRSGDIDPAIIFYLKRKTGLARDAVETLLNKAKRPKRYLRRQ